MILGKFAHLLYESDPVTIIHSPSEMQSTADSIRASGRRIGVVPTMGFLHAGHLSLAAQARSRADVVVMTIFVNPTQFAPTEDLSTYPRDLPRDIRLATEANVDILFVPDAASMYPEGFSATIIAGEIGNILEGAIRPGHFSGVLTVVAKLFHLTLPHVALFGQKDFQQAFLIEKMVRDLNFDVEIVVAPTKRESDGLAMSSRNIYLSTDERRQATALSESLKMAEAQIQGGERQTAEIIQLIARRIAREPSASVDYITVADAASFQETVTLLPRLRYVIALAVRVGKTRLLDNIVVATE